MITLLTKTLQNDAGIELSSTVDIKIGDGAPFCRTASFILLSFSFPSVDPNYNSENGSILILKSNLYTLLCRYTYVRSS